MPMTGKYGGTEKSVEISAELETQLLSMLREPGMEYDDGVDVEFYPCSDGVIALLGVTGGVGGRTRHPLFFLNAHFRHNHLKWLVDLKSVYDAGEEEAVTVREKELALLQEYAPEK